jgi:hypothetical protein
MPNLTVPAAARGLPVARHPLPAIKIGDRIFANLACRLLELEIKCEQSGLNGGDASELDNPLRLRQLRPLRLKKISLEIV